MTRRSATLRQALLAWCAVFAMLFTAAGPVIAGHLPLDRECDTVAVEEHDHTAHRVGAAEVSHAAHCATCHLTRAAGDGDARPALLDARRAVEATVDTRSAEAPRRVCCGPITRGPPSA